MYNSGERRFIRTIVAILLIALVVAGVCFLVYYLNDAFYKDNDVNYTVSYISDGVTKTQSIAQGEKLSVEKMSDEGRTFGGWYLDEDLSVPVQDGVALTADISLYAKWTINSYYIYSYLNYGSNTTPGVTVMDYSQAFSLVEPIRTGYSFAGWYYDAECKYICELTAMPSNDVSVYAKWKINSYYLYFRNTADFTFDPEVLPASTNYEYGATLALPELSHDGYVFDGWYSDAAYTKKVVSGDTMPANRLTLYTKWTPIEYRITFDSNGGSEIEDTVGYFDEAVTEPTTPIYVGYNFVHWYVDNGGAEDENTAYTFDKMPIGGVNLKAKWQARNDVQYKVEHYQEIDGVWVAAPENTEILYGTTGTLVSANIKENLIGYYYDAANVLNYLEGVVAGDGSLVLKVYYRVP